MDIDTMKKNHAVEGEKKYQCVHEDSIFKKDRQAQLVWLRG